MDVDVVDLESATDFLVVAAAQKRGAYVCVSNVHMCMEVFDSPEFARVVNSADLVIPDGRPIVWAQRLLGQKAAMQVRGQDIMVALCDKSRKAGLKIGLYGGSSSELVDSVASIIARQFPGVQVDFTYSPPFRALTLEEDEKVVQAVEDSDVDFLFVGIGCPKQERWMAEHVDRLSCVMVGVGAAFDFIAGEKKHAPRWMQSIGMEWFFRLLSEPRRLWKRYFSTNPRFCWYFAQQYLFGRSW